MRRLTLALAFIALLPRLGAAQETIEYYATDTIGSIRIVFNVSGTTVARQDYAPFGRPLFTVPAMPREGFGGQEKDDEADEAYFHARMFQARLGRFARPDPIGAGLLSPQRWNRYAYALNSPLVFTDSTGLVAQDCPTDYCETVVANDPELEFCFDQPWKCWGLGGGGGGWGGSTSWSDDGQGGSGGQSPQLGETITLPNGKVVDPNAHCTPDNGCLMGGVTPPGGAAVVAAGAVAQRALAAALGGAPKTFPTDRGKRFVDVFAKGTAYEVKTGYQNIRTLLENQIAKDVWLRDNGFVQAVEWVFYRSPVTGLAGPGPALRDALYQARIPWVFK